MLPIIHGNKELVETQRWVRGLRGEAFYDVIRIYFLSARLRFKQQSCAVGEILC